MKKNILARFVALLALLLVFGITACGGDEPEPTEAPVS